MKLTDIIELAKQGYKPADIKELVAISEETESKEATQKAHEDDQGQDNAEDMKDSDASGSDTDSKDEAIDYKKLYEEEKKKTENLQKDNLKKDMSGQEKENDLDTVLEAVKGFM